MAFDAHANLAYSTVATPPSPAASGPSLVVAAGEGARFPAVPFNAIVWPAGTIPTPANAEIVRVTARVVDTLTITRTQEATSARAVVAGDQIAGAFTAKLLTDIEATTPASILTADGDLIIRSAGAPTRLALSVPAANVLNVLGVANGETQPSYKSVFDGTNPAAIVDSATPGTSLVAAHRDHVHSGSAYALLAGRGGGQTVNGDTASGGNLTLHSTAHATKGKVTIGSIGFDEANTRIGIGTTSPGYPLDIQGTVSTQFTFSFTPTMNNSSSACAMFQFNGTMNGTGTYPAVISLNTVFNGGADILSPIALNLQPSFAPPNAQNWSGTGTVLNLGLLTGSSGGTVAGITGILIFKNYGTTKPTTATGLNIGDIGAAGITTAAAIYITKPTGSTSNYYFQFDTGDGTALGAYSGRLAIYVNGVGARYIPYYS